jgi:hypothetical protein
VSPVRYEMGSYIPEDDILHIVTAVNISNLTGHTTYIELAYKKPACGRMMPNVIQTRFD